MLCCRIHKVPLFKCMLLWGRWDLFVFPSLHCRVLMCAACSREDCPLLRSYAHNCTSVRWGALVGEADDGWQETGNYWWKYVQGKLPGVSPTGCWCVTVLFLPVAHRLVSHLKIWHLPRNRPGELVVLYIIMLSVFISLTKVLNDLKKKNNLHVGYCYRQSIHKNNFWVQSRLLNLQINMWYLKKKNITIPEKTWMRSWVVLLEGPFLVLYSQDFTPPLCFLKC